MDRVFDYALLRYVGDPVRGEGVNVAVIVVDAATGEATIREDRMAARHLQALWPDFDKYLFARLIRDLSAALGAPHQMVLGQRPRSGDAAAAALTGLSALLVNQFQISEPRMYRGESVRGTALSLYRRFVERPRERTPRTRYLTRSQIRDMVAALVAEWARGRNGLEFRAGELLPGARASHPADLVAYEDGKPRFAFVAVPLSGGDAEWAPFIRDSLPLAVTDVRERAPDLEFFAVLGDGTESEQRSYEGLLAGIEGLTVADLDEVRRRFAVAELAAG
ncbi:MAG: DUF3037 domain-containing protein [Dehalococcoidia bacterium]